LLPACLHSRLGQRHYAKPRTQSCEEALSERAVTQVAVLHVLKGRPELELVSRRRRWRAGVRLYPLLNEQV